jgi:cell division septation protein DedD
MSEVRTQKKLGFWIGFGWETQNPKKIQKSKKSKIQTQKKSKNPESKPKKNPKNQKIQNPNPKNIQIQFFFLLFKIDIQLI